MSEPQQATMDQATSVPHWKKAFPDFDGMTFEVPEGFEDSSWRNDACPSFVNGELGVQLYANYADPALREVPGARRFALLETDDGSSLSGGEVLADTDDFAEVLAAIDERRAAKAPKVG